jgi:leucine dehydrogenase
VILADIDEEKRALVDELPRARWADPNVALQSEVDVVAPCALGGAINETNVDRLRCRIVCGSANNQLAHDGLADDLAAHRILYAPDFIANAGGLINVAGELEGYDRAGATRRAARIDEAMRSLLDEARRARTTPLAAAYALARRRLAEPPGSAEAAS